jgi:hypothetical protein
MESCDICGQKHIGTCWGDLKDEQIKKLQSMIRWIVLCFRQNCNEKTLWSVEQELKRLGVEIPNVYPRPVDDSARLDRDDVARLSD